MSTVLKLYWSPDRGDYFSETTADGEHDAQAAGYVFIRLEGYGYPSEEPGTVPLRLYWSSYRGDNYCTATAEGEKSALAAGYTYIRDEGYVYPDERPGTVPLKLFWSPARADNFTTATAQGEQDALAAGYQFIRVEGHVSPRPTEIVIDHRTNLSGSHHMETHGTLLKSGHLDVETRTWTDIALGGFHGVAQIMLADIYGRTIGNTAGRHQFGVDGRWIGRSDLTVHWAEEFDPRVAERTASIHVNQVWAPQYSAFQTIIEKGTKAAKPMVDLIAEINGKGGSAK